MPELLELAMLSLDEAADEVDYVLGGGDTVAVLREAVAEVRRVAQEL